VDFNVTPEVKAAYNAAEPDNIDSFRVDACIMLPLIKNPDKIVFCFDDGTENPIGLVFTREWAESVAGADLWEESSSAETLDSLIARANEHVENAYASAEDINDEGLPAGTFAPTNEWTRI
jgi:hypothetical protein